MSDLFPLVTAVLRDKAVADAQAEIAQLRSELNRTRSVEIIHARDRRGGANGGYYRHSSVISDDSDVKVYASAQFQDGNFDVNPNLFSLNFEQKAKCRLADLRSCRVCVGGGIEIKSLDDQASNRAPCLGYLDREEEDGDFTKVVLVCFSPNSFGLTCLVRGWPRDAWEAAIEGVEPYFVIEHLVETVAANHPDATVEFQSASFVAPTVHGALKRVLPRQRRTELKADLDRRDFRFYVGDVLLSTTSNFRENSVFAADLENLVEVLVGLGFDESTAPGQEELMNSLIELYANRGLEGLEEYLASGGRRESIRQALHPSEREETDGETGVQQIQQP